MKTPPDPEGDSPASPPLDPLVAKLAERLRASSQPAARALIPLSAAERSALAARLLGGAKDEASGAGDAPAAARETSNPTPALAAPAPVVEEAGPRALTTPLLQTGPLPRRRRAWQWVPVALAACIAALLWLLGRPPAPAPVAYEIRAQGDLPERSDTPPPAGAPLRLRPSTRLLVVLAPREAVPDASLRMLVVRNGEARLLRPPFENDGRGTLTIDRSARDALGDQENGAAELVWIAGRPMPDDAEAARIAADPAAEAPPGTAVLRRAAVFEDWGGALRMGPGDIEYSGCRAMVRGPACEMAPGGKLVLWAPFDAASGQVKADGLPATVEAVPAAGGTRWTVTIAAGTRQITMTSPRFDKPYSLAIAPAPSVPAIEDATARLEAIDLPGAEEALRGLRDDSAYARVAALRLRARIARRYGDQAKTESLFREAIAVASAEGRLSDEIDNRHRLAREAMVVRRDHASAEEQLAAALPLEEECPPWRVHGAYYRGVLAEERGRYAEALATFTGARRTAERLGLSDIEGAVLQPLAGMLSVWGRDAEALELLQRAVTLSSENPCERAGALTNLAWAEHRAARTSAAHAGAASRAESALEALGDKACGSTTATVRMNAALAQAAAGRTERARGLLEQVRATLKDDARLGPWAARLEVELDLAENPARALETTRRLEKEMQKDPLPEIVFEAAFGRAEALDALNRPEEAGLAYEEAARRETEWAAAAPLGEGRARFFERQRNAFEAWVDFAVRRAMVAPASPEGQRAAAGAVAGVVRQSLGRFFATLQPGQVARNNEGARAPAAPPAGEVHLYYHPVRVGWVAVAIGGDGKALVRRVAGPSPGAPPDRLAEALLAPVGDRLAGAARVVVFADRALGGVDFGDLPWSGGALSERAAVAYGAAVQPHETGSPAPPATGTLSPAQTGSPAPAETGSFAPRGGCGGAPFALVVLDPSRNLGGARRAGERIAARLGSGAAVLAGEGATRAAVLAALRGPCTRLFQYDGHAALGGAKDGMGAALSLADGPLSVSDLLDPAVVPRVPDTVVLSGCETGREEGLGVARAFLSRGSRQVLATTEKVDDALAERLMEALHERAPVTAGAEWDLAAALPVAVRSLRGSEAGAGPWSAFRVLVP